MKRTLIEKMTDEERKGYVTNLDTEHIGTMTAGAVKLALLHEQHTALTVIRAVRELMPILSLGSVCLIANSINEYHEVYGEAVVHEDEWLKLGKELKALQRKLSA